MVRQAGYVNAASARAATVLGWTAGLGFGLPCVYAIWYFADRGRVWIFLGFPTYGAGPFEDISIETTTTTTLLAAFLLVCVAELIAGWMLWQGRRAGVMLAIALLPVEFVFWIGFALPFGPILGVARTGVMIVAITGGVAGQQPPVKARRDPADAPRSCRSRRDSGPQPRNPPEPDGYCFRPDAVICADARDAPAPDEHQARWTGLL